MIFEGLGPAKTSSRLYAVRFLQKHNVHEYIKTISKMGPKMDTKMEPERLPWALLGLTLVIWEGPENLHFLVIS